MAKLKKQEQQDALEGLFQGQIKKLYKRIKNISKAINIKKPDSFLQEDSYDTPLLIYDDKSDQWTTCDDQDIPPLPRDFDNNKYIKEIIDQINKSNENMFDENDISLNYFLEDGFHGKEKTLIAKFLKKSNSKVVVTQIQTYLDTVLTKIKSKTYATSESDKIRALANQTSDEINKLRENSSILKFTRISGLGFAKALLNQYVFYVYVLTEFILFLRNNKPNKEKKPAIKKPSPSPKKPPPQNSSDSPTDSEIPKPPPPPQEKFNDMNPNFLHMSPKAIICNNNIKCTVKKLETGNFKIEITGTISDLNDIQRLNISDINKFNRKNDTILESKELSSCEKISTIFNLKSFIKTSLGDIEFIDSTLDGNA